MSESGILPIIRRNLGILVVVGGLISSFISGLITAVVAFDDIRHNNASVKLDLTALHTEVTGIHEDIKSVDGRLNELHEDQAVTKAQLKFLYERAIRPVVVP